MNVNTELKEVSQDHWHMHINGVDMGVWEKSQLRQHMEKIDNTI